MHVKHAKILTLFFSLLIVGIVFIPSLLFFAFSMLPSMLVFFLDRDSLKVKTKAISVLNFIGSTHAILYSLNRYDSFRPLTTILADPINWLLPYGMAAFGLGVFLTFPSAVETWMKVFLNRRERTIRERQEKLVSQWGDKIRDIDMQAPNDKDLFDS